MLIFPSSSRDLPVRNMPPVKADLRRETTAWRALVWAYADEHVRAATNFPRKDEQSYASNGLALMRLGETGIGGGAIHGLLEAHQDAFAIDALVAAWFEEWPEWRNGVAVYAERRRLPPRPEDLPRFAIVGPERNAKGNPREIWNANGRKDYPFLCPLEVAGWHPAEIEKHAQFIVLFDELLVVMKGLKLDKWVITSTGN